jgi:hypothetical protein
MTMYKCENDCYFWGQYNELLIIRDTGLVSCLCPICDSEDVTEWVEAG